MYQFFMCTGFYNASLLHYHQGCRLSVPCPDRLCRTSFLVFACRAPQSGFGSSGGCKAREPAASAPSTPVRKHYASPACSPPRGNPFCRCKAIAGKGLDGELLSVMLAYHRQASDAALHGVVLCIKDKHSYNNSNRSLFTFNFAFLRSLCFPCFQL